MHLKKEEKKKVRQCPRPTCSSCTHIQHLYMGGDWGGVQLCKRIRYYLSICIQIQIEFHRFGYSDTNTNTISVSNAIIIFFILWIFICFRIMYVQREKYFFLLAYLIKDMVMLVIFLLTRYLYCNDIISLIR